jgi:hypothetical protein
MNYVSSIFTSFEQQFKQKYPTVVMEGISKGKELIFLRPFMLDKKTQKTKNMAHAWNPSYWGG